MHTKQTDAAAKSGLSNCSVCASLDNANKAKVWKFDEIDADHVKAWSKGSKTTESNCEMLCKPHNSAKGNY